MQGTAEPPIDGFGDAAGVERPRSIRSAQSIVGNGTQRPDRRAAGAQAGGQRTSPRAEPANGHAITCPPPMGGPCF